MNAMNAMNEARPAPKLPEDHLDHLKRYLATDGSDGHLRPMGQGGGTVTTLILTTTGRKSGARYLNPLIYGKSGNAYVVVASNHGRPANPGWYLNLSVNPLVGVQVLADKFNAKARTAAGEEREMLWNLMTELFPSYPKMATRTEREIPVVVLERL